MQASLLDNDAKLATSPMRWYCLAVVTTLAAWQGGVWNNFGPISEAVEPLFGWDAASVALLANWGPICYLMAFLPSAWLLDTKGLRVACAAASALVFVSSVVRCVHVEGDAAGSALMHLGQFFNGLAGPVAMSAGPVLSARWFAPHERTMATALVGTANYGGTALMFVLGSWFVPANGSVSATAARLRTYMWAELAVSAALMLAAIVMPASPPSAPAASALVGRTSMAAGLRRLLHNRQFWALALAYGVVTGFVGAWGSMLGPNMQDVLPRTLAESQACPALPGPHPPLHAPTHARTPRHARTQPRVRTT